MAAWAEKLGLEYKGASFRVAGTDYASERQALIMAGKNPLDPARMVLILAGNDALRTVKLALSMRDEPERAVWVVLDDGQKVGSGLRSMSRLPI